MRGGDRPPVTWHAPFLTYSGYADEARAFVLGLRERGADLRAEPMGEGNDRFLADMDPGRRAALQAALNHTVSRQGIHVVHQPGGAATRMTGGAHHVARTMFETDALPPSWVPRLNSMDEIWVPAEFNVQTFRAAGVTVPIHVVPGGVDTDVYRPGLEPLAVDGLRGTVFLSVFEWTFRKGWDVLLKAWARTFTADDDVTLLLRTRLMPMGGRTTHPDELERRLNTYLRQLGTSRKRCAPIVVLDRPVTEADMPRLYATADAYVSSARGEGWGRPLLEAMACGLPTAATRWSGNLAFMDDDNSLLVDIEAIEAVDGREELDLYQGQRWARPSATHLETILDRMARDAEARAGYGSRGRAAALRWTWSAAAAVAEERIDAIARSRHRAPTAPSAPAVRWVGDEYSHHSLAIVNRAVTGRLIERGAVDLELVTTEDGARRAVRGDTVAALEARTGPVLEGRRARVEVRHQWPPDWRPPHAGAWVAMQPWEFGGLPDQWLPALEGEVDEVWCYSTHVRDCYVASGVDPERLRVIPLAVDTEVFRPDGPRYPLATRATTKLLFVGGTVARKGIDVLLDAYRRAFTADDDVCLVIKATGGSTFYATGASDEAIRAAAADPTGPATELITAELAAEDLAALYRSCTALVHPARGEGFGLTVAEAMATGLPVVVTGHGAVLDFCDADTAYLIPATPTAIPAGALPPSKAGSWWAEPDTAALVEHLRHIVEDGPAAAARGERGRHRVVEQLSWDRTTALIEERLLALAGVTPRRLAPPASSRPAPAAGPPDAGRTVLAPVAAWPSPMVDEVISSYVAAFDACDPVTLVVAVGTTPPAAALQRVAAAIVAGGADPETSADIVVVEGSRPRQARLVGALPADDFRELAGCPLREDA